MGQYTTEAVYLILIIQYIDDQKEQGGIFRPRWRFE